MALAASQSSSSAGNNASGDNAEQMRRRATRRLAGAAVMLLTAIIAVPLFLERDPPPLPDTVDVRIPPVEGTKFEPKQSAAAESKKGAPLADVPVVTEPSGSQAGAGAAVAAGAIGAAAVGAAAVVAAPSQAVEKTPPKAAVKPSEKVAKVDKAEKAEKTEKVEKAEKKPAEKAVAKKEVKEVKEAAPAERPRKAGQLTIQILAVRDAASAKGAYDRVRALKMPVYNDKREVSNGVVHRVRVGPYDTPAQAEKARARLARAGFEAKVITLQ